MAQTSAAMNFYNTDQTTATGNGDRVWSQWTIALLGESNTTVWEGWCENGTDGTATVQVTTTQTQTDRTWNYWCYRDGSVVGNGDGTRTVTNTTWRRWNSDLDGNLIPAEEVSEEERERLAKEQAERTKQHEEATAKAKELLRENLSPEQREAYDTGKPILVRSQSGKEYEIRHGTAGNVVRLDDRRKPIERYCIHPKEDSPVEDVMLTQLCWLRWCEEDFLRTANATPVRAAA